MKQNKKESADDPGTRADGGAVEQEKNVDYLDTEINILKPGTPFMRDHQRIIWTGFFVWLVVVFGPPTLTFVAPDVMSSQIPVLGFPLHYFLIAIGGPTGALLLSLWYTRKRDALDRKYGIGVPESDEGSDEGVEPAAADGGVSE